jgi:hypothetical protein
MHSALVKPPFWKSEELRFDPDRKPRPDGFSHGGQDSHQEPSPVLQGPAPFVLTPVGQRAEELRDQIAMRGVQRDAGKARLADLPRRELELANGALDLRLPHRPWFGEIEASAAHDIEFDHRRRQRRWVDGSIDLAAGMAELAPELRTARAPGGGQPRKLFLAAFVMDDDVQRPFQVIGIDLDIAREQQPRVGYGPPPV